MSESPARTTPPPGDQGADDELVFPPEELGQIRDLEVFIRNRPEPGHLIGPDGAQIPLPREVYRVLRQAVEVMRDGNAVLVASQSLLLTTQEAAELLGVSRPTVVKLLEDGSIPFAKPNRHRRVRLEDVLHYRAQRHAAQRAALDQLTEDTSALGLYEDSAADYAAAVEAARRRRARRESE